VCVCTYYKHCIQETQYKQGTQPEQSTHTHTHTHTFGGVLEDQIHARLVIEVAVKTEDVVVPQVRLS